METGGGEPRGSQGPARGRPVEGGGRRVVILAGVSHPGGRGVHWRVVTQPKTTTIIIMIIKQTDISAHQTWQIRWYKISTFGLVKIVAESFYLFCQTKLPLNIPKTPLFYRIYEENKTS